MRVFNGLDEIRAAVGEPLGYSDYQVITQSDIDAFGALTGGVQIGITFVWEVEGQAKPACVAEMLIRSYF